MLPAIQDHLKIFASSTADFVKAMVVFGDFTLYIVVQGARWRSG
jgi:hypothetical protein